MTKKLIVKRATTDDIKEITYLLTGYRAFYKRQLSSIETISEFILKRFHSNEVIIFIALVNGKAAGIAQLYPSYSTLSLGKIWTLYDLYIDQNYRNQGIGNSLLEQSKKFAIEDGGFRLDLKTEHNNLPANALYEKFGFSKDEIYIHYQMMLD